MSRGAIPISAPKVLKDENGTVIMATIKTVFFEIYSLINFLNLVW